MSELSADYMSHVEVCIEEDHRHTADWILERHRTPHLPRE